MVSDNWLFILNKIVRPHTIHSNKFQMEKTYNCQNVKNNNSGSFTRNHRNRLLLWNRDILRQDITPESFKEYTITRQL